MNVYLETLKNAQDLQNLINMRFQDQIDKIINVLSENTTQLKNLTHINDHTVEKMAELIKTQEKLIKTQEKLIIQQRSNMDAFKIKAEENCVMVEALQMSVEILNRTITDQNVIINDLKTRIVNLENKQT